MTLSEAAKVTGLDRDDIELFIKSSEDFTLGMFVAWYGPEQLPSFEFVVSRAKYGKLLNLRYVENFTHTSNRKRGHYA
jgi:hypothetical protein